MSIILHCYISCGTPPAAPSELLLVSNIYQTSRKTPVLSSGDILQLERVSPEEIILNPPEKLVIETQASGGYRQIEWRKNAVLFDAANRSDTFFVRLPDEFSSFFEIFVREPTTVNDQGLYEVYPIPANPEQTEASPVHYVVTLYGKLAHSLLYHNMGKSLQWLCC